MRQYNFDSRSNLDRYVNEDLSEYSMEFLFPAYKAEFEKMMTSFGIDKEKLFSVMKEMMIENRDLVDVEFFEKGRTCRNGVLLKKNVAKTKLGEKVVRGEIVTIEGKPVDMCAVNKTFISVTSKEVFKYLLCEKYKFLEKESADKKILSLTLKEIAMNHKDLLMNSLYSIIRENSSETRKNTVINVYYNSSSLSMAFHDTSAGTMHINADLLAAGEIDRAINEMDEYYKSQVVYFEQYEKDWRRYKDAVMASEECKWLVDNLKRHT